MTQHDRVPEYILEESERMSQRWDLGKITFQMLIDLQVDLVVLSREQSKLADMSSRIADFIQNLRQQEQDT